MDTTPPQGQAPAAPAAPAPPVLPDATVRPAARAPGRTRRPFDTVRFATTALCLGCVCLGIVWRFVDLDYPRTFSFDEHHFVRNARNYITHQADWNDHPPLGKLVLVPAMLAFGDRGLGWRLSSAVFGLAIIALAGLNAAKLFRDRRVGLLAAAFVAIDGFFLSYARTALIDNPLTAFVYAALACMLYARSLTWFAAAALFVGLAVSCKWTGVCVLLLAPILLHRHLRRPSPIPGAADLPSSPPSPTGNAPGRPSLRTHSLLAAKVAVHSGWMFVLASLIYVAISAAALHTTNQTISMATILRSNWDLLQHHAGFTVWDNPGSSRWYTWPLLTHPLVMHFERAGGTVRATSTIGNVLLWYATTACMAIAAFQLARAAFRWLRRRLAITPERRQQALTLGAMAALTLPFILTHRQSYIFHYLGAYGLGLALLAAFAVRLEKRVPGALLGFLLCAIVVSLIYLPLWTGGPLTTRGFELRLVFPGWR